MEWIFCFRKGNRRSVKNEKRILPYQKQQIKKTRKMQKTLQTLCDREDDSSEKAFVSTRFTQKIDTKNRMSHINSIQQKTILEVHLTDSSSENSSVSYKRSKPNKSERDQEAKSVRNSGDHSTQKVSRSIRKEKNTSKRYQISSDSTDSTDSSQTSVGKYTSKHNIKSEKIVKRKMNRTYLSDSESDESDTRRASNISKRHSKVGQRNKKMDNLYEQKSKNKMKKRHLTSESENEKCKRGNRGKSEANRVTSYINNDERKHKSSTKKVSNIQEDSDNSSSKEFQKRKLQKMNRKYSTKLLVDLDIDHTKSPYTNNSANDKSEKQSTQNFNDIKTILEDCKKMCSNFQMYIETIEQLYSRKDEEQLILKSMEKIDKLKTVLEKKQKDLTTSYQSWSKKKSDLKRSHKVISEDKESSKEREKCMESENKYTSDDEQDRNKTVSECDSEEIFSANETKTEKTQTTQRKVDISRMENCLNKNGTNTNDEDKMLVDESKNKDKNNMDDLAISPVVGTLKEKTSIERLTKDQLFSEYNKSNNETQLTDENTNTNDKQTSLNTDIHNNEIDDSPSRDSHMKKTLENDGINQSDKRNDIINESMDMFDTSLENVDDNRTEIEIETNYNEEEFSHTSKNKLSDLCESTLQDIVPTEKERKSLLSCDFGEEKDLSPQDTQDKMAMVNSEETYDNSKISGKMNTDNESLDDAEALAKKALLATDSDTSDIVQFSLSNKNMDELMEDLITNDTNRTENEKKDNDSDVNSVSTVMLSTFKDDTKEVNTDAEKDNSDIEKEIEVEKKNHNELNKRSRQETSSSDEDAEKAAKKALLESNSDDSTLLSSESEKFTDKTSESDSSEKNVNAKLSLLASYSESSSSELAPSETANISKDTKCNHEGEEAAIVTRLKKKKLNLDKNYYYKNDKKLRMSCQVHLTRLSAKILKSHSHALRMSREYLEHKALKRYRQFSVKHMSIVLYRLT